ncbi:hypothetical protein C8F04DRAFT_1178968 [Mycena alexandri]|uniref:Uncharacterized protein n=1 Tax=Mycena alexandri TaxID=1745969 RepID=A0AAD6T6Q9_9AGAR|nr:hypothetical protein C8F04DRAFT_1178968 [Mycena alexandri]
MNFSPPLTGPNIVLGEASLPRRPEHHSAIYGHRNATGLYDSVADQILALGKDALANIDYPKDYTRQIEDWSKNHRFMDRSGNELRTTIVGEILGPAMGTLIRAHGNYFARDGDDFKPIDDKSKIKDTLALGPPTQATVKLHNTFLNQVIGASQVVTANSAEDLRNERSPIIKNWTKPGIEGSDTHKVMMTPSAAGTPAPAIAAKRRLDQVDEDEAAPSAPNASGKPEYTDQNWLSSFSSTFVTPRTALSHLGSSMKHFVLVLSFSLSSPFTVSLCWTTGVKSLRNARFTR